MTGGTLAPRHGPSLRQPPNHCLEDETMWKRLSVIWMTVRGDARLVWHALRHPATPAWFKGGVTWSCSTCSRRWT